MIQFWKLINWPDYLGYQSVLYELVDNLSRLSIKYATLVKEMNQQTVNNLTATSNGNNNFNSSNASIASNNSSNQQLNSHGHAQSVPLTPKMDAYQRIVITTNNIERVRDSFRSILNEIDYYNLQVNYEKMDKSNKVLDTNRYQLESCIEKTSDLLGSIAEQILELIIINRIESNIETHMFYMFESPESVPAVESVSRLIQYLDSNLVLYKDYSFKANFDRLLNALWNRLIKLIDSSLKKDQDIV